MTNADQQHLERVARALGARDAERLDVERMANAVVARLRAGEEGPRLTWWRSPTVLRIAAAVVVLASGGLVARRVLERPDGRLGVSIPGLVELSATELLELSDSLILETPLHESVAVGLQDLTEEQLRELLRLMEG